MEEIIHFKSVLGGYIKLYASLENRKDLTSALSKLFERGIVYFDEIYEDFSTQVNTDRELLDSWISFTMLILSEIEDMKKVIDKLDKINKSVIAGTAFDNKIQFNIAEEDHLFVIAFAIRVFGDEIFYPFMESKIDE